MKEHFQKKIIHQIHTFGLSWRQVRRFRDTFGLDQEHESDINSEEEEGEDNMKQKSPNLLISNAQKTKTTSIKIKNLLGPLPSFINPVVKPKKKNERWVVNSKFFNDSASSSRNKMSIEDEDDVKADKSKDTKERSGSIIDPNAGEDEQCIEADKT